MFLQNIFLLCIASTTIITGNSLLIVTFTIKLFCRLFGSIFFKGTKIIGVSIEVSLILKHR
jgi:hypothetical protein